MESDRAVADLGQAVEAELALDRQEKPKQPTRRFVGRKAANAKAVKRDPENDHIEDSGAIQGSDPIMGGSRNDLADLFAQWLAPGNLPGP